MKQLEKEWGDKVNIRQFLSKHERGRRASKSIEVSEIDWVHNYRENIVRYNRERDIKGVKVHIMVEEYSHAVLVSGQLREKDVTMAMVIAKDKLINLQQC